MLISAREACFILATAGVSKHCALQVLRAGLAGSEVKGGGVALYDEDRIHELAQREVMTWSEVDQRCPAGLFVARREISVSGSRDEQVAALAGGWDKVSPWTWLAASLRIRGGEGFPFVATVGGLVVLGAEITGKCSPSEFVLGQAGAWFSGMEGCWFPTGPGRPWVLHVGPPRPEKIAG